MILTSIFNNWSPFIAHARWNFNYVCTCMVAILSRFGEFEDCAKNYFFLLQTSGLPQATASPSCFSSCGVQKRWFNSRANSSRRERIDAAEVSRHFVWKVVKRVSLTNILLLYQSLYDVLVTIVDVMA